MPTFQTGNFVLFLFYAPSPMKEQQKENRALCIFLSIAWTGFFQQGWEIFSCRVCNAAADVDHPISSSCPQRQGPQKLLSIFDSESQGIASTPGGLGGTIVCITYTSFSISSAWTHRPRSGLSIQHFQTGGEGRGHLTLVYVDAASNLSLTSASCAVHKTSAWRPVVAGLQAYLAKTLFNFVGDLLVRYMSKHSGLAVYSASCPLP